MSRHGRLLHSSVVRGSPAVTAAVCVLLRAAPSPKADSPDKAQKPQSKARPPVERAAEGSTVFRVGVRCQYDAATSPAMQAAAARVTAASFMPPLPDPTSSAIAAARQRERETGER